MGTRRLRLRGLQRLVMAAGILFTLLACSDGYPTEDVPQLDPSQMTQAQLLQAMNQLGAEKHLRARWRYALAAGCELEIRVRNGVADKQAVLLEGAAVNARSEDEVFNIFVVPKGGADPAPVLALESRRWSDSVRMRSLLAHLERSCAERNVPAQ